MKVLSIDAWRYEDGWTWNNWYDCKVDFPNELLDHNRKILKWFREWGFLSDGSKGRVAIEDDGYNIVIQNKSTREPLFAIVYGEEQ